MSVRIYSNPVNESDPMMTSDVEVFHSHEYDLDQELQVRTGYYFWYCFGGCLPESGAFGPYRTQGEAIFAAQNGDF